VFTSVPFVGELVPALMLYGALVGGFHMTLSWAARIAGRRNENDGWDGK
jgi:hypothetical protein